MSDWTVGKAGLSLVTHPYSSDSTPSICSQNTLLQPLRPGTTVVPLTLAEIANYMATKKEYLESLRA